MISQIHHIAIIVSDIDASCLFYEHLLGFQVENRLYREDRNSWKIDLSRGGIRLELFTFPNAPIRPSYPEAIGLRHIAFAVQDIQAMHAHCTQNTSTENIRLDEHTGKLFFFFADPDGLPIEIYEQ
jgi:glyoxylase I family protein